MHALQPKDRKTMNKGWRGVEREEIEKYRQQGGINALYKLKMLAKNVCQNVLCCSASALQETKILNEGFCLQP